jgi:predicted AAA+ superfamily ATPase
MARVESLVTRIESVLPQLLQPDWNSSIAFRYRKRSSGHGTLEPCDIGAMRLDDLQEISDQKEKIRRNTEQFVIDLPTMCCSPAHAEPASHP